MDILYTIIKTGGYLISLGILSLIPVIAIAALFGFISWNIAVPAMGVVLIMIAYPAGMLEGIKQERAAWEIAKVKQQKEQDRKDSDAQFAMNESAAAHNSRERNIRRSNMTTVIALNETIVGLRLNVSELKGNNCINEKVPARIIDALNKIR